MESNNKRDADSQINLLLNVNGIGPGGRILNFERYSSSNGPFI